MSTINNQPPTSTTKTCSRCGQELPLDKFCRNSKSKDGCQQYCKACALADQRDRRAAQKASKSIVGSVRSSKPLYFPNIKGSPDSPLYDFTPRQLMEELQARGFHGKLVYVNEIEL